MATLSGCRTRTDKVVRITLPEMPLMSQKAVEEMKQVCIPREKCDNFNDWLNKVYTFRIKYYVYKEELNK